MISPPNGTDKSMEAPTPMAALLGAARQNNMKLKVYCGLGHVPWYFNVFQ